MNQYWPRSTLKCSQLLPAGHLIPSTKPPALVLATSVPVLSAQSTLVLTSKSLLMVPTISTMRFTVLGDLVVSACFESLLFDSSERSLSGTDHGYFSSTEYICGIYEIVSQFGSWNFRLSRCLHWKWNSHSSLSSVPVGVPLQVHMHLSSSWSEIFSYLCLFSLHNCAGDLSLVLKHLYDQWQIFYLLHLSMNTALLVAIILACMVGEIGILMADIPPPAPLPLPLYGFLQR